MKIKLSNGQLFEYSELNTPKVQSMLRRVYDRENANRARCMCNADNPPELVISFIRPEGPFYISRMPGQSPLDHGKNCLFRNHTPHGRYTGRNGLTLAVPVADETPVTDHNHAHTLLDALWRELEQRYLADDERTGWRHVKDLVRLISETIDVNRAQLLGQLSVVVPKKREYLTELDLQDGRVIVCELMDGTLTKPGHILIKAKGIKNRFWINDFRVQHLEPRTQNTLTQDQEERDESTRYIMLMTAINGLGQTNDLHCNSVGIIKVDQDTFVRKAATHQE